MEPSKRLKKPSSVRLTAPAGLALPRYLEHVFRSAVMFAVDLVASPRGPFPGSHSKKKKALRGS